MKVYLEVYGCTANKSDYRLAIGILKENKHSIVENIKDADVLIILTCTVIDTTEQRMLSRLRVFKKTGKQVIVTGCMASIQKEKIISIIPEAKLLPAQYIYQINETIENKTIKFVEKNKTLFSKNFNDVIAPILISEGCMFSCSYCITSLARGKLKSYPLDEVISDVNYALKQGCKEIQLTAQDTSSYGLDKDYNLGDLLRKVSKINGDFKVRVGMMNPFTCMKNIDSIIAGFNDYKIYKFLHIPIQSGDNDILNSMNRKYNIDDFLKIIKRFRQKFPDITISTDVIVGFPGETEQQFKNTINLLKKVKPDITNITRFSARPFTKAKEMKGRLKTEIVKERSKMLTKICDDISKEKNLSHIGKKYNLLITEKGKNNNFVGRAENYKPVVIKENVKIGDFISVKIIDSYPTYLVGNFSE